MSEDGGCHVTECADPATERYTFDNGAQVWLCDTHKRRLGSGSRGAQLFVTAAMLWFLASLAYFVYILTQVVF